MSKTSVLIVFSCLIALPAIGRAQPGSPRDPFHEGLCPRYERGQWGCVDHQGEWVIPRSFFRVNPFLNGIAEVTTSGPDLPTERFHINYKGERVDEKLVRRIQAGLRKIEKDGKWGFADPDSGEIVIEPIYDEVWDFSEGLALTRIEGSSSARYRWIDYEGSEVIVMPGLQQAESFHDGLAIVKTADVIEGSGSTVPAAKVGFIDRNGKFAIEPSFDAAMPFCEGRARVQRDQQWGFIDYTGKIVVPTQYVAVEDFSEGLALVRVGGFTPFGFIDLSGKVVIPTKYSRARSFSHGTAYVDDEKFRGFIDHAGNRVFEAQIEVLGFN